jgi:LmbE family N-acetylglucosaminyl deacetylase
MLTAKIGADLDRPLRVLCLGAHIDDIEIECGGTLLRMLRERPGARVDWVVFSADDQRVAEARASAHAHLVDAGESSITVHRFRESYFPFVGDEIKNAFEELKVGPRPDIVFSHRRDDQHQDHQTIAQFAWNTFRDQLILEYGITKYEGDLGRPNL